MIFPSPAWPLVYTAAFSPATHECIFLRAIPLFKFSSSTCPTNYSALRTPKVGLSTQLPLPKYVWVSLPVSTWSHLCSPPVTSKAFLSVVFNCMLTWRVFLNEMNTKISEFWVNQIVFHNVYVCVGGSSSNLLKVWIDQKTNLTGKRQLSRKCLQTSYEPLALLASSRLATQQIYTCQSP